MSESNSKKVKTARLYALVSVFIGDTPTIQVADYDKLSKEQLDMLAKIDGHDSDSFEQGELDVVMGEEEDTWTNVKSLTNVPTEGVCIVYYSL